MTRLLREETRVCTGVRQSFVLSARTVPGLGVDLSSLWTSRVPSKRRMVRDDPPFSLLVIHIILEKTPETCPLTWMYRSVSSRELDTRSSGSVVGCDRSPASVVKTYHFSFICRTL